MRERESLHPEDILTGEYIVSVRRLALNPNVGVKGGGGSLHPEDVLTGEYIVSVSRLALNPNVGVKGGGGGGELTPGGCSNWRIHC